MNCLRCGAQCDDYEFCERDEEIASLRARVAQLEDWAREVLGTALPELLAEVHPAMSYVEIQVGMGEIDQAREWGLLPEPRTENAQ